jgi:predicted HTH transcriptional regulator
MSAFANRTGGGIILFGLDESADFSITGVGRSTSYRLTMSPRAPEKLEPRSDKDHIIAFVKERGAITNTKCR